MGKGNTLVNRLSYVYFNNLSELWSTGIISGCVVCGCGVLRAGVGVGIVALHLGAKEGGWGEYVLD